LAEFQPQLVAFVCEHYGLEGLKEAGEEGFTLPAALEIIRVPCSSRVEMIHILNALEKGADGVYLVGCLEGDCYFRKGNLRAKKRIGYLKDLLTKIGLEAERIEMFNLEGHTGDSFRQAYQIMEERLKPLGPSFLKNGKEGEEK